MEKKMVRSVICLLGVMFLLSACGPRSREAEAKKFGLQSIKDCFQVEETEEVKHYFDLAKVMPLASGGTKQGITFSVTVSDDLGEMLYYAVISIKPRKMLTIQQNPSLLKLTKEEEGLAANMASSSIFDASVKNEVPKRAAERAALWVQQQFEPNSKAAGISAGQAYEKNDIPARAFFDSTIIMDSGAVYGVTVCWPSMDIVQVTLLDS